MDEGTSMKSIIDRVNIIEKQIEDIDLKDLHLYISQLESRIVTLEDIIENKMGIYIPKK